MRHELKTWPVPFQAVLYGRKRHEVRTADRAYSVFDELLLREFVPCEQCAGTGRAWDNGDKTDCGKCDESHGRYTGRQQLVVVTYITEAGTWGLPANKAVLSIRLA